ncbi:MAG: alpha-D-xyloside xylohydrolase, partial [Clostridiales bacterium]|nr:alpha-D-xyloside xylohydrolase [Clostridiales bacterium]
DFAERIPIDVIYQDGSDPVAMHNYYTYLYNKAVFELLKQEKGEKEAVLFARSATAGGQQFPVHWGGDCSASYASMAETLRGGLSLAMSGFSFWSHDISGFEQTASPDLYKRWAQFGLLSTHSRLHGSTSYRVPWLFDEEACDVVRYFTNLKCEYMPYIYQMAVHAHNTGIPVMRPMVVEFPTEAGMPYLDMQYMLGDSLLVAPIFKESGEVSYYLPEGSWTHLLSDEVREGGKWYTETYDYFSLPLYVRENTLLAKGKERKLPDYDYADGVTLHLYQLKEEKKTWVTVPNIEGEIVLTATAERVGNRVLLELSSMGGKPSIYLHHIDTVTSVTGAASKVMEHGILLMPEDTHIEIQLTK